MNTMIENAVHISVQTLTYALKACSRVADGKTIPILGYARLQGTLLSATNLDQTIHVSIGDYADVDMLLHVRSMLDLLKGQPKDANVELFSEPRLPGDDPNAARWIRCTIGELEARVSTLSLDDWPVGACKLPQAMGAAIPVPKAALARMLLQTVSAIASDDSKYMLSGALIEMKTPHFSIVATDGHRLHQASTVLHDYSLPPMTVLVHKETLASMQAFIKTEPEGTCYLANLPADEGRTIDYFEFTVGRITIVSRILSGQFPNYNAVMPKANNISAVVDTDVLLDAVKRMHSASKASRDSNTRKDTPHYTILTFLSGAVKVCYSDANCLTVPATVTGLVKFKIATDYLFDILLGMGSQTRITAKDKESALLFSGDDCECVLMPVRM